MDSSLLNQVIRKHTLREAMSSIWQRTLAFWYCAGSNPPLWLFLQTTCIYNSTVCAKQSPKIWTHWPQFIMYSVFFINCIRQSSFGPMFKTMKEVKKMTLLTDNIPYINCWQTPFFQLVNRLLNEGRPTSKWGLTFLMALMLLLRDTGNFRKIPVGNKKSIMISWSPSFSQSSCIPYSPGGMVAASHLPSALLLLRGKPASHADNTQRQHGLS